MSFNFSQLQQSVDRLLINSSEAINKLVDLTIAPARDVTVQYYDRNGNLVTQTTPNLMKVLNTVQANINSYMEKTVYVDQVNGNDDNDGTQARPFKTLQKAFNSVPVGGVVNVHLLSDYVLTSIETLYHRTCNLNLNGKTLTTEINPTSPFSSSHAGFRGFIRLHNSVLQIIAITGKIVTPVNNTGKPLAPPESKIIAVFSLSSFNSLLIDTRSSDNTPWCEIHSGALYGVGHWDEARSPILHFGLDPHFRRIAVVNVDADARLISVEGAILAMSITINNDGWTGYLRKPDGTNLSIPDVISGLVYYSVSTPNGTRLIPRNYIGRNDLSRAP